MWQKLIGIVFVGFIKQVVDLDDILVDCNVFEVGYIV